MLVIYCLYFAEMCDLCAQILQGFYHEVMLDFVKAFSVYTEEFMLSLSLSLFRWWITIFDLLMQEPVLPLWKEINLITVDDLFNVFLNLICNYFFENFPFMFIRVIDL